MHRRHQHSLATIYKNLLVTKRDILDLRQSIGKTMESIRKVDEQIVQSNNRCRMRIESLRERASTQEDSREAEEQQDRGQRRQQVDEALNGEADLGESKRGCPECGLSIKLRDLDSHMRVCAWRECYKCNRQVYCRAYGFHLLECGRKGPKNPVRSCKRLPEPRPMVLPCSLVIDSLAPC